jgi:hypothetical protein
MLERWERVGGREREKETCYLAKDAAAMYASEVRERWQEIERKRERETSFSAVDAWEGEGETKRLW